MLRILYFLATAESQLAMSTRRSDTPSDLFTWASN